MDSFELNKIAGALLMTLLVYLAVQNLGDYLFHVEPADSGAYAIDVPETNTASLAAKPAPTIPIAELLKTASIEKGIKTAKKCVACHSFERGGANQIGPGLWGIVDRNVGVHNAFSYSKTLAELGGVWDYERLDAFLKNPKKWAPGTAMAFAGLRKPSDRANLIAYLDSLK